MKKAVVRINERRSFFALRINITCAYTASIYRNQRRIFGKRIKYAAFFSYFD